METNLSNIGFLYSGSGCWNPDLIEPWIIQEPEFEERNRFFRVTFHGPGDKILDLIRPEGEIDLKGIGLNERQISALAMMVNEKKRMTNQRYRQLFGVSDRTASRELKSLVEKELIKRSGKRRGAIYVSE